MIDDFRNKSDHYYEERTLALPWSFVPIFSLIACVIFFLFRVSHQLSTLQQALLAWRNFDMHMLELRTVLREDHTALNVLDQALKQEEYVGDVASTFQNIAKYLPDKHHDNLMKVNSYFCLIIEVSGVAVPLLEWSI